MTRHRTYHPSCHRTSCGRQPSARIREHTRSRFGHSVALDTPRALSLGPSLGLRLLRPSLGSPGLPLSAPKFDLGGRRSRYVFACTEIHPRQPGVVTQSAPQSRGVHPFGYPVLSCVPLPTDPPSTRFGPELSGTPPACVPSPGRITGKTRVTSPWGCSALVSPPRTLWQLWPRIRTTSRGNSGQLREVHPQDG